MLISRIMWNFALLNPNQRHSNQKLHPTIETKGIWRQTATCTVRKHPAQYLAHPQKHKKTNQEKVLLVNTALILKKNPPFPTKTHNTLLFGNRAQTIWKTALARTSVPKSTHPNPRFCRDPKPVQYGFREKRGASTRKPHTIPNKARKPGAWKNKVSRGLV